MNSYLMTYPKHKTDMLPFRFGYYRNVIFNHCENEYLITKVSNQINLIKDYKLLCELQDKNSYLYLELVKAIEDFNKYFNKYIISNSISKKILGKAGIFINKQIKIELYQSGAVRYLNSKNQSIPMINILFVSLMSIFTCNFIKYISTIVIFTNI